ncbi:hypothetical protein BH11MYX2_BH11MYX2_29860 [soil metagenome]
MRASVSGEGTSSDDGRRELDIRVGLGVFASANQLEHLLSISRQVDLEAGQVLFKEGDPAVQVFHVMSGVVELRSPSAPLWTIEDAGTAGLIDFLLDRPHSRTAKTLSPTSVLELDAADYRDYLEDNFDVSHRILARMSSELAAQSAVSGETARMFGFDDGTRHIRRFAKVEIPVIDRMMLLRRMPVFAHASTQALATLGQGFKEVRFGAGDVIASAGERPSVVSVLVEGTVELTVLGGQPARRTGHALLAHVEELADAPRLATVTAVGDVVALQIERDELLDLLEEHFDLMLALFRFLTECQEQMNDVNSSAGVPLGLAWR